MKHEIGETAGNLWRYLEQNGPTSVTKVKKELDVSGPMVERAIGWLAREEKIQETRNGKSSRLELHMQDFG